MKKFIFVIIFVLVFCVVQFVMVGYDKDLCEWFMIVDQIEVEI